MIALSALLALAGNAQDRSVVKEVPRTTEKELNVVLTSAFGSVIVRRGDPGTAVLLEREETKEKYPAFVDYAVRNRVGYADIMLGEDRETHEAKGSSFSLSDFDKGRWFLSLSDAIPVSLEIELGVGSGDFNLTGLRVRDFTLSAGASNVTLAFDEPNNTRIENLTVESGVSKFDGRNLCNANFKRFRFKGGVGAYTLDFGGVCKGEMTVEIEVGLGIVTLFIPREMGARIAYDKSWMSRIDCDEDFHETGEDSYLSENYNSVTDRMNVVLNSGLGSIKVRRR
jgi:hypothetical protein